MSDERDLIEQFYLDRGIKRIDFSKKSQFEDCFHQEMFPNIDQIISRASKNNYINYFEDGFVQDGLGEFDDEVLNKQRAKKYTEFIIGKNVCHVKRSVIELIHNGKMPIDMRIDLHGSNLHDAFVKIIKDVSLAKKAKKRMLLIITGKGEDVTNGGEIKNSIMKWVNNNYQLNHNVLYVCYAHSKHGGVGAFYFYLRAA